jgi:alginate O-acetyltransferase complex protein AlgJ
MNYSCLIVAIIFVVVLGAISARSLEQYHPSGPLDIGNGEWAKSVEDHYNNHFPIKTLGTNIWTALQYGLLGEGKRGVVIGDDGWFYSDEEFKTYTDVPSRLQQQFDIIARVAAYLSDRNSELVLVLVPTKVRIYPDHTNGRRPAKFYEGLYDQGLDLAKSINVVAPDLRFAFTQAKTPANDNAVFLKTDTHWTPYGAEVAAQVVARDLLLNDIISATTGTAFTTEQVGQIQHRGDLLNYLPLGPFSSLLAPPLEALPVFETHQQNLNAENDLFGDAIVDIALVGSSYSANPAWNFAGALKQFMQRDLVNYAEEGHGPILPMLAYLASSDFQDNPPALIIWEFPERFLPVSYDIEPYAHLFDPAKATDQISRANYLQQ